MLPRALGFEIEHGLARWSAGRQSCRAGLHGNPEAQWLGLGEHEMRPTPGGVIRTYL